MIKVGIIGAAGYTAGELIRLLVNHPEVEITFGCKASQGRQEEVILTCLKEFEFFPRPFARQGLASVFI